MKKYAGYTLLEVMVALVIFVILAGTTSYILYQAFNTRARVNAQANQLNELQLAITLIKRDTEQVIERASRGNEMHSFPPFVGRSKYLEFTHGGVVNPNGKEQRSTLARIAYRCVGKKLIRRSWEQLDTVSRSNIQDKTILSHLDDCSFSYLSRSHQTLNEWREYALQQNQTKETLPLAIQANLTIHGWGNMSMLFPIPESLYAE